MDKSKVELLSAEFEGDALIIKIKNAGELTEEEYNNIKEEYSSFFPDVKEMRITDEHNNFIDFQADALVLEENVSSEKIDFAHEEFELKEAEEIVEEEKSEELGEKAKEIHVIKEESVEKNEELGDNKEEPKIIKEELEGTKYVKNSSEEAYQVYNSIDEKKRKHLERLATQRQASKKTKKASTSKSKKEKDPRIIYGSLIKQEPKSIASIEDENSTVCYEGRVFSYDSRLTKSGYLLVSFSLVDSGDGISAKYFLNEKKQEDYIEIKNGTMVKVLGTVSYDEYSRENSLRVKSINLSTPKPPRQDLVNEKRVEFKIHSNMSQMSGIDDIGDIIKTVDAWGHKGLVVCDEGAVQSYPEAMKTLESGKLKEGFKLLYGLNALVIDSETPFVNIREDMDFDNTDYVVFDIETTGLFPISDEIIEIGAFKIRNGEIVDKFVHFVKPNQLISLKTIELTGINDEMV